MTTAAKVTHTPGPWEISSYTNHHGYSISAKGVGCIAERWWPTEQSVDMPIEANARLIAAAPDMLEALERVSVIAEREKWFEFAFGTQKATAWGFLQKAIAKAKGGAA